MPEINILPIAEREARVAARHRRTYQMRMLMALVVVIVIAFTLWLPPLLNVSGLTASEVFVVLTWITYAFSLITGASSTIDCISQEKRQGTLGLLFLTNLHGYDVVLGKFASSCLKCFYGLLATFPVLGIPMLVGGVGFAEFSRVMLALTTTLLLSLSLGIFISSVSRKAARAVSVLLVVLLMYGFGLSYVSQVLRVNAQCPDAAAALDFVNSRYLVETAFDRVSTASGGFWITCSALISASAALLACASWLVPRTWQEKLGSHGLTRLGEWWSRKKYGGEPWRSAFRARLLERNPITWLSGRSRVPCFDFLLVFLGVGLVTVAATHLNWGLPPYPARDYLVAGLAWEIACCVLHVLFLAFLASFACRGLAEDRRSGALEFLTVTPLSVPTILHGCWSSLLRRTAGPLIGMLLANALVIYWFWDVSQMDSGHRLRPLDYISKSVAALLSGTRDDEHIAGEGFLVVCAVLPTSWVALGWVGMWMAMRVTKPAQAPLAALGLVLGLPWSVFVPLMGTLECVRVYRQLAMPEAFGLALWAAIALISNLGLTVFTRRQLRKNFRVMAASDFW